MPNVDLTKEILTHTGERFKMRGPKDEPVDDPNLETIGTALFAALCLPLRDEPPLEIKTMRLRFKLGEKILRGGTLFISGEDATMLNERCAKLFGVWPAGQIDEVLNPVLGLAKAAAPKEATTA